MNRTIVIADLHGCYDEAIAVLQKLAVRPSDRVIFAGDLVDRGPKPRECVELAMQHECVLGNHEEKHLQQRRRAAEKLSPDHLRTRDALEDRHYEYLAKLPIVLKLPEHGAAVVHAGAFPGVPLDAQEHHHLLHIQNIKPPAKKSYWPSKSPDDHHFWTNYWQGPERLIFGHSVLSKPLVTEHAVGIDTGAVFGGGLTAVVLPTWELVSVPSTDSCNGRKSGTAPYVVHGDVRAFS
ncbi:MAG: metallophosphoesterase [Myxococcaceae bacterium]|nr:metallophosphoesterase [Myxococcaceae bacterium]